MEPPLNDAQLRQVLATNNPDTFLRNVINQVLMAPPDQQAAEVRNQIRIFRVWQRYWLNHTYKTSKAYAKGRQDALRAVPVGRFGRVDYAKLNSMLEELRSDTSN